MRLKTRNSISLSSTSAEEEDIADIKPGSYETSDALGEGSARTYKVASGVSSQSMDLAGLSEVNFIYVRTNKAITLHVTDGSGTHDIPIALPDGNDYGHFQVNTTGVTALAVSNSSGSTARVLGVLAGDEE